MFDLYVLIGNVKKNIYTKTRPGSQFQFPKRFLYLIHHTSFGNPFYNVHIVQCNGQLVVFPYLMLRFTFIGRKQEFEDAFRKVDLDVPAGDQKSVVTWTQDYIRMFVKHLDRESLVWIFDKDGMGKDVPCNVNVSEKEAIQACQGWKRCASYDPDFAAKLQEP